MKSENEELKKQVIEMGKIEKHRNTNLARGNKLAGKFALHEERKEKMFVILTH